MRHPGDINIELKNKNEYNEYTIGQNIVLLNKSFFKTFNIF
jgi:hypothetical protein